jgi:hypothetical protein
VTSRAVVVVGMHRSGTSVVARGLGALSVYFGNNFFDSQPDNPTDYWEDKTNVGRQEIRLPKAQRLWLVHLVPFLHELYDKRFVVVDYDLLTVEPRAQLERIARTLNLPSLDERSRELDRFAGDFLDKRHNAFSMRDFDATTEIARLAHTTYFLLHDLAIDQLQSGAASFWFDFRRMITRRVRGGSRRAVRDSREERREALGPKAFAPRSLARCDTMSESRLLHILGGS